MYRFFALAVSAVSLVAVAFVLDDAIQERAEEHRSVRPGAAEVSVEEVDGGLLVEWPAGLDAGVVAVWGWRVPPAEEEGPPLRRTELARVLPRTGSLALPAEDLEDFHQVSVAAISRDGTTITGLGGFEARYPGDA